MSAESNNSNIPINQRKHTSTGYVIAVCIAAALGGTLFGYDQGVISGALNFFKIHFSMSSAEVGLVSGILAIGAMVGCLVAGFASDAIGRKAVMVIAGGMFTISSLILAISPTVPILILGRILSGFAIGMAATVVPLYISEVAPARIRGTLVTFNQFAFAIGMTTVYIVNALIANLNSQTFNINFGWRWMFASGMVPAVIFFVLGYFVPESPRFLYQHGKDSKALSILIRLNGEEEAKKQQEAITTSLETAKKEGHTGLRQLFAPGVRYALVIALVAAACQQLTGTIAVGYYAPIIFQKTGVSTNASLVETIGIGFVKIIFVGIFMIFVDRFARKQLLKWGGYAMAISLVFLAVLFSTGKSDMLINILILVGVLLHTAFYELSWGGGTWVVVSEIFPTEIRGRAMSLSSMTVFLTSYFVSQLFPMMLNGLGGVWTFLIFAVFCVGMAIFAQYALPDTTGKSLEQIEAEITHQKK
ncbi:sugar porter family MFS transporter [Bifidobacterium sp. ESL0728]|uniref:sugar porter family MFS transporter n=1 Tax=Bifidobacterium sp. ESL0728 TaxID=2983220 RepID=UPI0023F863C1|nr:sugar porter family MFS transporter [Bifidobacterium sp. ESL0728]WEV58383.1 sugar porter family MFS transporter [Bifidobacterium sp. ESL0728]